MAFNNMNHKKVLKDVLIIRDNLYRVEERIDSLLAVLREEEILKTLKKGQVIKIEQIQRKFKMGFASTYRLMDILKGKNYISRIGKKSTNGYKVIKLN